MAEAYFNGKAGVWRTVGGRRIFIAEGQSLKDAMKASGKFKNLKDNNDFNLWKEENSDKIAAYYTSTYSKDLKNINQRVWDSLAKDLYDEEKEPEKINKMESGDNNYLNEYRRNGESKGIEVAKNLPYENPTMNKVDKLVKDYNEYNTEYQKYAEQAKDLDFGSPEYKEMSAKRSEAYEKAKTAKNEALTEFSKAIPDDEMYDIAKQVSGIDNLRFTKELAISRNGEPYIKHSSNDIKDSTGPFSAALKNARLEEFNSSLYIDSKTNEPIYWGSLDIRYEHKDGGSNGMKLLDYKYTPSKGWEITDASGYKYFNGKKLNTLADMKKYFQSYGYSEQSAADMAKDYMENRIIK